MNSLALLVWILVLVTYVTAVALYPKAFVKMIEEMFYPVEFAVFLCTATISLVTIFWVIFKDANETAMLLYVFSSLFWAPLIIAHWFFAPEGITDGGDGDRDRDRSEHLPKHVAWIVPQQIVLVLSFIASIWVTVSVWDDSSVVLCIFLCVWVAQCSYDAFIWNASYFTWVRGRLVPDAGASWLWSMP